MEHTRQGDFDKVWDYFVVKGNARAIVNQSCKYRTNDGRKCALGLLLEDDEVPIDNSCATSVWFPGKPEWLSKDVQFYRDLQLAHDQCYKDSEMWRELEVVAKQYSLTIPQTLCK